jgi:hypothetical protein
MEVSWSILFCSVLVSNSTVDFTSRHVDEFTGHKTGTILAPESASQLLRIIVCDNLRLPGEVLRRQFVDNVRSL